MTTPREKQDKQRRSLRVVNRADVSHCRPARPLVPSTLTRARAASPPFCRGSRKKRRRTRGAAQTAFHDASRHPHPKVAHAANNEADQRGREPNTAGKDVRWDPAAKAADATIGKLLRTRRAGSRLFALVLPCMNRCSFSPSPYEWLMETDDCLLPPPVLADPFPSLPGSEVDGFH